MEQQVAATLLDKGIKVRVTAPLLFRLFGRANVGLVIKPPSYGTINRINDVFMSAGITGDELKELDEMDAHLLYKKFGRVFCRIAAMAWLNGYLRGLLLGWIVSRWLYWRLTVPNSITLISVLIMMTVKEGFMNTIRSTAGMKTTTPNLSQKEKGS